MNFYRPQRRGDLDNRIKVLADALQGILYSDDKQVSELHAYLHDDKQNPRVEVEVWATGEP
jgi:Holliday junction resolvase RusA-like endonuclease